MNKNQLQPQRMLMDELLNVFQFCDMEELEKLRFVSHRWSTAIEDYKNILPCFLMYKHIIYIYFSATRNEFFIQRNLNNLSLNGVKRYIFSTKWTRPNMEYGNFPNLAICADSSYASVEKIELNELLSQTEFENPKTQLLHLIINVGSFNALQSLALRRTAPLIIRTLDIDNNGPFSKIDQFTRYSSLFIEDIHPREINLHIHLKYKQKVSLSTRLNLYNIHIPCKLSVCFWAYGNSEPELDSVELVNFIGYQRFWYKNIIYRDFHLFRMNVLSNVKGKFDNFAFLLIKKFLDTNVQEFFKIIHFVEIQSELAYLWRTCFELKRNVEIVTLDGVSHQLDYVVREHDGWKLGIELVKLPTSENFLTVFFYVYSNKV